MKKFLLCSSLFFSFIATAQVAITTDASSPDASAMLDIKSTEKGILIPRMLESERIIIPSPARGLLVYQTDGTPGFYYNSGSPATPVWQQLGAMGAPGINGTNGNTWYNGTGVPAPGLGVNNDLYINTSTANYYLKVAGNWALQGNLTGPQGIQGVQGPAGTVTPEYAYIYNVSGQFITLGNAVTFDSNGPISSGITHNPGSSFIFINVSGNYKIEFSGTATQTSQFSVYRNGVSVPGSRYGTPTAGTQNHGAVIVAIIAGDVIQLNNTGSSGHLNLTANTGGTLSAVNASVLITKL
jgi:hypothetical protein